MKAINKYLLVGLSIIGAFAFASCTDMNDSIDQYLSQGEIIYIAKSDSVKLYAGDRRFMAEFWLKDIRATKMTIFWNQEKDFKVVNLDPNRNIKEPVTVIVDNLKEGSYTLSIVTSDDKGHVSVPDEQNVSVYGELFQASCNTRIVKTAAVSGNKVTITWGNSYSTKEYGIKINYSDLNGNAKELVEYSETMGKTTVLTDVDLGKPCTYQTIFLPEPDAIDFFYTSPAEII